MKRLKASTVLFSIALFALTAIVCLVGCTQESVATILKASIRSGGGFGIAFAVQSSPESILYLRVSAPIVCEASKGTNVQPAWIVAKLEENAAANAALNPIAKAVFNTLWGFYTAAFEKYGASEVQNRKILQAALEGVCEAIVDNLPRTNTVGVAEARLKPLPPHLN